jgi:hypothetical protein
MGPVLGVLRDIKIFPKQITHIIILSFESVNANFMFILWRAAYAPGDGQTSRAYPIYPVQYL